MTVRRARTGWTALWSGLLVCVAACTEGQAIDSSVPSGRIEADLLQAKQLLDRGRTEAALEAVDRLVGVAPRSTRALLLRGSILEKAFRPHDALAAYEQALSIGVDREQRLFAYTRLTYLCLSPLNVLDLERAGEYLGKAREAGLAEADALRLEAMRLECSGQTEEAISAYERAIDAAPDSILARRGLAALLIRCGHLEKARILLREALDLQFREPGCLWLLHVSHEIDGSEAPLEPRYRLPLRSLSGPAPPIRLVDVAEELGVDREDGGRGSAWGDFDGDGDLDLATVGSYRPNALFRNESGHFVDVAGEVGFAMPGSGWACQTIDYDDDGDLDLFVTRAGWFGDQRNLLYRNDGGHFEECGEAAGLIHARSSLGSAWADYDLDGDLDLFVANGIGAASTQGAINSLYRNEGSGRFVEVAAELGVADEGRSIGAA
ncbi:MAG: tetratricopeptide repeat protein [Planctomycetota bacterium]